MPIYEYRCPECGHQFERMQRVSDAPPACPSCGHVEVRKMISQTSFVLKGGGWYSDHYGLKSSSTKSSSEGAAASTPSTSTPSADS